MEDRDKKLIENYLKLGQLTHKSYLNKNEDRDEFINISNEIVKIESQIYNEKAEKIPTRDEMICPRCKSNYDNESIFCANCGLNLDGYYSELKNCEFCNTIIPINDKFCRACGGIQEVDEVF